jgi:predicted DNA-binding transcriptional regulator AlpA
MNETTINTSNQYGLLLSAKEAQEFLGIPRNQIYSLAKIEDFPKIKIGNRIFFSQEGLRIWVNDNIGKEITTHS